MKKSITAGLFFLITSFIICSHTLADVPVQSVSDGQQFLAYIPYIRGDIEGADIQIGNEAVLSAQALSVQDEADLCIHTVILFDNSFSISEKNREIMKQTAQEIILAHTKGEKYTLAVFDSELHILIQESEDYTRLAQLAGAIEYENQLTYFNNVIHEAVEKFGGKNGYYSRFIVLSDGCDDSETGYTSEEITLLMRERNYPLYAVGSRFDEDISALEDMFRISRSTGAQQYLLDDMTDIQEIPKRIRAETPLLAVAADIPFKSCDGSEKRIKIIVHEENGDHEFLTSAIMPFAGLDEVLENAETAEAAKTVEAVKTVEGAEASEAVEAAKTAEASDAEETAKAGGLSSVQEENAVYGWNEEITQADRQTGADGSFGQDLSENDAEDPGDDSVKASDKIIKFLQADTLISGVQNMFVAAVVLAVIIILFAVFRRRQERNKAYDPDPGTAGKWKASSTDQTDNVDQAASGCADSRADPDINIHSCDNDPTVILRSFTQQSEDGWNDLEDFMD